MDQKTTARDRNCHKCHFLVCGGPFQEPFKSLEAVSTEDRERLAGGSFLREFNFKDNGIYCAREVWDTRKLELVQEIVQAVFQARGEECFSFRILRE